MATQQEHLRVRFRLGSLPEARFCTCRAGADHARGTTSRKDVRSDVNAVTATFVPKEKPWLEGTQRRWPLVLVHFRPILKRLEVLSHMS
mmetsp:Transcript_16033/g.36763  ORF Transcript_16033/g.36763 Transcript_16033/m.36763 type:complete len:89 (+) Transcript_16033:2415-2681(+)